MKPIAFVIISGLLVGFKSDLPQENNATAVADAELAFAKRSRETNTVDAFQSFLAGDAIMFRQGDAVDGKKLWADRQPDSTLLNWWPILADASKDGDLGYTTGPYQFFNSRADKLPVGNGYYSTIWKKQKDGTWKIKVDLGVRLEGLQDLPTKLSFADRLKRTSISAVSFSGVDEKYNSIVNRSGKSFLESYFGKSYRIHRALISPSLNQSSDVKRLEEAIKFKFKTLSGEQSSSGDLAYSYGNVTRSDTNGERKANYLRVWKAENGQWRIVLDVITE